MDRARGREAVAEQQSLRDRLQARAREQTGDERGPYLTPQWLDHSFVLPAQGEGAGVTLPSPRGEYPATSGSKEHDVPVFERAATPDIDFAAVVRRADTARRARMVTAVALLAALVAAVAFQLTSQPVVGVLAVVAVVVTLAATATRVSLRRAPVPYLDS
jgi:hypothetical protein